jgi:uncharacterized membrane protein
MTFFATILVLHIAAGGMALLVVGIPLFSRKGSRLHVAFGRAYAYAMAVVAVTGVPLAAHGLSQEDPARRANALFLFFVALLASESAWSGIRALRSVRRTERPRRALDIVPPSMLFAGAIGLLALGLYRGAVLYLTFGALGILLATSRIAFWRKPVRGRADAIVMHIGGMGVSSITTFTAFVITNGRYLFHLRAFNLALWLVPTLLGAIAVGVAQRAWRARLGGEEGKDSSEALSS